MRKDIVFLILFFFLFSFSSFAEDITLIKHAKRVEAPESNSYTVQKDDTLWKIFLMNYRANIEDMPDLYKRFRELNPQIHDLNHIMAGQKIVIPKMLKQGQELTVKATSREIYMIKQGQHIAMVLRDVYGLPDNLIFNEYLNQIKELNPEIEDLNRVEPGQKIRIPEIRDVVSAVKKSEEYASTQKKTKEEPREDRKIPERIPSPEESEKKIVEHKKDTVEKQREIVISQKAPLKKLIEEDKKKEAGLKSITDDVKKPVKPEKVTKVDKAHEQAVKDLGQPSQRALNQEDKGPDTVVSKQADARGAVQDDSPKRQAASRLVRNTLLPALKSMGGKQRDKGTYFMPMSGGSSVSIDTNEIPVMELDTGRRIILDVSNKISPEVKDLIEQAFPSCKVISGPVADIENLMDRVLSVSGYFSVNRDPSPLLVGEEEKVRFFGKWIVYKDYSRHNVFVVNILSDSERQTPGIIRDYASRFGIDLIELGGIEDNYQPSQADLVKNMDHSYRSLLDHLGISYEVDKEIELVSQGVVRIAYKAPLLIDRVIITGEKPDETMLSLLKKRDYLVLLTDKEPMEKVLKALKLDIEGPPVKIVVSQHRTELELPALMVGNNIILKRAIGLDIANYLVSEGKQILAW